MFQWDAELADALYMTYFVGTNYTMHMCTPRVPIRPDMHRKLMRRHPGTYSMVSCITYELGYLEKLYKQRNIFSSHASVQDQIYLPVAAVVLICGVFGE